MVKCFTTLLRCQHKNLDVVYNLLLPGKVIKGKRTQRLFKIPFAGAEGFTVAFQVVFAHLMFILNIRGYSEVEKFVCQKYCFQSDQSRNEEVLKATLLHLD